MAQSYGPCRPAPAHKVLPRAATLSAAVAETMGDRAELRAWRLLGAQLEPVLAHLLATQGDRAERDLIAAQHALTELRTLTASPVVQP